MTDPIRDALDSAWNLGQLYCQQADSESWSQNRKATETKSKFTELVEQTCAALSAQPPKRVPLADEQIDKILDRERMRWATSPPTHEFANAFARAIERAHGIAPGPKT